MAAATDLLQTRLMETYTLVAKGELTYKKAQPTLETLIYSNIPRPQKTAALRAIIKKLHPQWQYDAAMYVHDHAKVFFDRPQGIPNRYLQPLAQQWAIASVRHLPVYENYGTALKIHRNANNPKVRARVMRIALDAVDVMPGERQYSNAIRIYREAKLGTKAKTKALRKAAASIDGLQQYEEQYMSALEIFGLTIHKDKKLAAKMERKIFAVIRSMKEPQQQYNALMVIAAHAEAHKGYEELQIKSLEKAMAIVNRMPPHILRERKREAIFESAPEGSEIKTKIAQKILDPIEKQPPEEQYEAAIDVYHKAGSPNIKALALQKAFAAIDFLRPVSRYQAAMDLFLDYSKIGERRNDVLQKAFSDIKYLSVEEHSGSALKIFNAAPARSDLRKESLKKSVSDLYHVKPEMLYKAAIAIISNATYDEYKPLRMRALQKALKGVDAVPFEDGARFNALHEIIKHAPKEGRFKDQIDQKTIATIKAMPSEQQEEAARSVIAGIGNGNESLKDMLSAFVPQASPPPSPEPEPGLSIGQFISEMRKLPAPAPAGL